MMRRAGLFALLFSASLLAGEGMWVPQQLPQIANELKKAGLKLDPRDFEDLTGFPMGAIISVPGCSASFVSPNGLLVTNHHCAYGNLQLNSTAQNNLIEKGFIAKSLSDEITGGPSASVMVLESIEDVTDKVQAGTTPDMDGLTAYNLREDNTKKLIAQCESKPGLRCGISSFFGGLQYRLFRNIEIKDVRLVYSPPLSIGKFGGDIDNWMWPRHTGDFSFLRAYVGKDGNPAPFSPDNVPYHNKRWLEVTKTPLREGDFVMVAGFPGETQRYATAEEVAFASEHFYPLEIKLFTQVLDTIAAVGKTNPDAGIKYESLRANFDNFLKKYQGIQFGLKQSNGIAQMHSEQEAFTQWLKAQGNRSETLDALNRLIKMELDDQRTQLADTTIGFLNLSLLSPAARLYRFAVEREKPNDQRKLGYQDRDLERFEATLKQLDRRYDPQLDKRLLAILLGNYQQLPKEAHVKALDQWLGSSVQKTLDAAYAKTKLGDLNTRLSWLKKDKKSFESSNDPFIQLAVALYPWRLEQENKFKARQGTLAKYQPIYMQGLMDYKKSKGQSIYPDANSTLRVTFGQVKGFSPKDGIVDLPFTTVQGIAQKATGIEPFDAPKVLLDAIAAKDYGRFADQKLNTLPVNFLSDLDITNGNSGSAMLNANGELIGLAFDGNWEGVSSDWLFNPSLTRTIGVDIRYVMWIVDKIYPAPNLVKELGF